MKNVVDDADRLFAGDAEPVDEVRLDIHFAEPGRYGLAASVHHHGLHPDGFQQNDVPHGLVGEDRVLHGAAAELDDGDGAAELLNVGKRLDEDFGFFDQIVHVVCFSGMDQVW